MKVSVLIYTNGTLIKDTIKTFFKSLLKQYSKTCLNCLKYMYVQFRLVFYYCIHVHPYLLDISKELELINLQNVLPLFASFKVSSSSSLSVRILRSDPPSTNEQIFNNCSDLDKIYS